MHNLFCSKDSKTTSQNITRLKRQKNVFTSRIQGRQAARTAQQRAKIGIKARNPGRTFGME